MKKIMRLFTMAAMLFTMCGAALADNNTSTVAEGDSKVAWTEYNTDLKNAVTTISGTDTTFVYVYLYNYTNELFLTSGGDWGTEAVLAQTGMKLWIEETSTDNVYYIHTNLKNLNPDGSTSSSSYGKNNDYLSKHSDDTRVYFDRSVSDAGSSSYGGKWSFTEVTGGTNQYYIYNTIQSKFLGYYDKEVKLVSTQDSASVWTIITRENVIKALKEHSGISFLGVTEMLNDSRFERNNKDVGSWKKKTTDTNTYISNYTSKNEGAFQTMRIYGTNTFYQTVTDLPTGHYRISCQGFYNGSTNNNAYLYYKKTDSAGNTTGEGQVPLLCATKDDQGKLNDITETDSASYCRAVTAGSIIAGNSIYATGEEEAPYFNAIYFSFTEGETLEIGVTKTSGTDDEAYVDNFRLFYLKGDPAIYINATATDSLTIDNTKYDEETIAYLRRAFTLNAWNALCLPFNVPAASVRQAFGDDVQLSKLSGINPNRTTQIVFETVDLKSSSSTTGIVANECYVIMPTQNPDVASSETVTFYTNVAANSTSTTRARNEKTKKGPIYTLYGATQAAYDLAGPYKATYTTTDNSNTYNLSYKGYYLKSSVGANSYIVVAGTMYHLSDAYTIYGTMWTLEDVASGTNSDTNGVMTLSIEGEDYDTSEINGLVVSEKRNTNTRIYNLNGMAVGTAAQMDRLPKGIYIMNGKKFVVR